MKTKKIMPADNFIIIHVRHGAGEIEKTKIIFTGKKCFVAFYEYVMYREQRQGKNCAKKSTSFLCLCPFFSVLWMGGTNPAAVNSSDSVPHTDEKKWFKSFTGGALTATTVHAQRGECCWSAKQINKNKHPQRSHPLQSETLKKVSRFFQFFSVLAGGFGSTEKVADYIRYFGISMVAYTRHARLAKH